jgi:serine/threonine protein kinase
MLSAETDLGLAQECHAARIAMQRRALLGVGYSDFNVQSVLGTGCNGAVLGCTVRGHGVASKVLYNYGHSTTFVAAVHETEYAVLRDLPEHWNVVAVLGVIPASRLTAEIVQHLPPAAREAATVVNARTGKVTYRPTTGLLLERLPRTLAEHVRVTGAGLEAAAVLRLSVQVVEATAHLARHGVVHCDLKLNNFMVDPSSSGDRVVLIDFGCALRQGEAAGDLDEAMTAHVVGGAAGFPSFGNTAHAAPEVLAAFKRVAALPRGSEERVAVPLAAQDAFATGVLLFEVAMGGVHPLPDYPTRGFAAELFRDRDDGVDAAARELRAVAGAALAEVVRGLLEHDPARRMTLAAAAARLREAAAAAAGAAAGEAAAAPQLHPSSLAAATAATTTTTTTAAVAVQLLVLEQHVQRLAGEAEARQRQVDELLAKHAAELAEQRALHQVLQAAFDDAMKTMMAGRGQGGAAGAGADGGAVKASSNGGSGGGGSSSSAAVAAKLRDTRDIGGILKTMRRHMADVEVQTAGLWAIGCVCYDGDTFESCKMAGAEASIIDALEAHGGAAGSACAEEVVREACEAWMAMRKQGGAADYNISDRADKAWRSAAGCHVANLGIFKSCWEAAFPCPPSPYHKPSFHSDCLQAWRAEFRAAIAVHSSRGVTTRPAFDDMLVAACDTVNPGELPCFAARWLQAASARLPAAAEVWQKHVYSRAKYPLGDAAW